MEQITRYLNHEAQEQCESSTNVTLKTVKRLFRSMAANYGAIFTAQMEDLKTQELWEQSWMATISGKRIDVVAKALTHCLDTHAKPFSRADFQEAYRSLLPKAMHQRNKEALALPSKTFAERKEMAQKMIARARELIGPEEKKEKPKGERCDRKFFADQGWKSLDYPQGEYEAKLGQLPPEFLKK